MTRADAVAAVAAATAVGALAALDGGYFAPTWGWAGLAAAWALALSLLHPTAGAGRYGAAWMIALTLFVAWVWASGIWSRSPSLSLLEGQRDVVYVAFAATAAVALDARTARGGAAGVVFAAVGATVYGFVVDVFPELAAPAVQLPNLSEPIGYANAMGLLATLAILLAFPAAVSARANAVRACAAAAVALLLPCLYLSVARGPWLALAAGIVVTSALLPRTDAYWQRALMLFPLPLAGTVAVAAVDTTTASVAARALLATFVCGTVVANAVVALRLPRLARAWRPSRRIVVAAGAVPVAAVAGAVVSARWNTGGVRSRVGDDLGQLVTLSGHVRTDYWSAALNGFRDHVLLGNGAGTFEQLWLLYRPSGDYNVLDAHNAYLEVLAELGPFGLIMFCAALAVPLAAALRAPRTPLVAGAAGAYAAFVFHAAVDWDWELPVLTVAALLCGSILVAAADAERRVFPSSARIAAFTAACGLAALSLAGLLSNGAIWEGTASLARGDVVEARSQAATAERWDLWSADPEQLRGEAELAAGNPSLAATFLRRALRREPNRYRLWVDLAQAATGEERHHAFARAHALNPRAAPR